MLTIPAFSKVIAAAEGGGIKPPSAGGAGGEKIPEPATSSGLGFAALALCLSRRKAQDRKPRFSR
ncbi:MAG: PEP-CTERM sorting domain-containing protein [Cyanobacteria bacterium P01_F01_bin.3]